MGGEGLMTYTKSNKKEEIYMELKELDEQIKSLNSHLEKVEEQLSELNSSKIIINKISVLKEGDELKVPVASGIYVTAKLKDAKSLLINVGAGVTVEKASDDVIKILDNQLVELSSYRENIVESMKKLIERVEELQKGFK